MLQNSRELSSKRIATMDRVSVAFGIEWSTCRNGLVDRRHGTHEQTKVFHEGRVISAGLRINSFRHPLGRGVGGGVRVGFLGCAWSSWKPLVVEAAFGSKRISVVLVAVSH